MIRFFKTILFMVTAGVLAYGCISPRQMDKRLQQKESSLTAVRDSFHRQLMVTDSLEKRLLMSKGGNEMLLIAQQQLQDRLLQLDDEVERLNGNLSSSQNHLGQQRKQLEGRNRDLGQQLTNLRATYREIIENYENKLSSLADTVALDSLLSSRVSIRSRAGSLSLNADAGLLFRGATTSRFSPEAEEVLESISRLLESDPLLELTIIGHTDNQNRYSQQGGARAFSAQRAVSIADELTNRYDLGANRITAAGAGAAKPLESNATEAGQKANRRIEFLITNSVVNLLRSLKKAGEDRE
ncbi:hypothetical protein CEQ90_02745 [Lewinellaceae bacterium SD302]|nr:hypothetical protein CEQ90_02745 [Lewinellaceae bacterium SD302]